MKTISLILLFELLFLGYIAAQDITAILAGSTTGDGFSVKDDLSNTLLRVRGDGNVGIGTTSPAEKLEVNGGLKLGTSSNANAGTIRWTGTDFQGYDGSSWESLTNDGDWTISGSDIYSSVSGNVGIGTTTPGEKLEVKDGNFYLNGGFFVMKSNGGEYLEYVSSFYLGSGQTYCQVEIDGANPGDGAMVLEAYRMDGNGGGYGAALGKQTWIISCEGSASVVPYIYEVAEEYDESTSEFISITGVSGPILRVRFDKKYTYEDSSLRIVLYGEFDPAAVSITTTEN